MLTLSGSSPRVWGQVYYVFFFQFCTGIIPTRVGTSMLNNGAKFSDGDHPHACGDKLCKSLIDFFYVGSSPRVWGQAFNNKNFGSISGIIPTRVGTSRPGSCIKVLMRDHPHACGDKYDKINVPSNFKGSSPRVWGQVHSLKFFRMLFRIIPTRVGTRSCVSASFQIFWDHPHACGDKLACASVDPVHQGSSPRVWGQASFAIYSRSAGGIIPTRVGTRERMKTTAMQRRDHPHACGDKTV